MSIQPTAPKRRIVLTAIGSLGDLHPYIALALGLQSRGHNALLATSACYRAKIQALGLGFHPIRPDSTFVSDPHIMRRMMHSRWGTVRVGREIIAPVMRQTYEDISSASAGADLLVSHPLIACATRLVSEVAGIPWASTMITPLGFMSAHDFPIVPVAPLACKTLRLLGPTLSSPLIHLAKRATRSLAAPWYRLRKDLGLPPAPDANPWLDSHSPRLVLALFSSLLAAPQTDWPPHTLATGFPIFDRNAAATEHDNGDLPPGLSDFLSAGPPPIVFTLAASASIIGEPFFQTSIAVAKQLGQRAVLITGRDPRPLALPGSPTLAVHEYAPFSALFPKAAAIVHAGGAGTTGLVMRSGRPSLVVPFAHDQLDNAARLNRLGLARSLPRHRYTPSRAAAELHQLLTDPRYVRRAAEIEKQMRQENAVQTACDALETLSS